jgi:hypothetical protein
VGLPAINCVYVAVFAIVLSFLGRWRAEWKYR